MGFKLLHLAFAAWWCVVMLVTGLTINCLQLLTLPLYWIHRNAYHMIINKLCYVLPSHLTFLAEWWGSFDLKLYHENEDIFSIRGEKSLVLFNHYSDLDWLSAWVFVGRLNCLGIEQVLMKSFVKFLPILGWNMWYSCYGFMCRNWSKDKDSLLKMTNGCKKSDVPYIITLYPEGTRRTPEKLKASQEYALEKNLKPLKHHLIPRTKGFTFIASQLKDDLHSIYDAEFAFPDTENSTVAALFQRGKVTAHFYLRRIPIAETKFDNEEEAAEFLMDLFKGKDDLLEYFEQNGKFNATEVEFPRKMKNLVVFLLSSLYSAIVLGYLVYSALQVYSLQSFLSVFFAVTTFLAGMVMLCIRITSTKKGSSFGLKNKKEK